jgi:general secretion pathway protein A
MEYAVWGRASFVVITGEIGSGKTTLIETLMSGLNTRSVVARVCQTQLNDIEFLRSILAEFGFSEYSTGKAKLLNLLKNILMDQHQRKNNVVLIIDEAQNLDSTALEEIRLLSGIETHKDKILNVILVGQPELRKTLESPEWEQLAQRVRLKFHLRALSALETMEYIQHRLKIAGASDPHLFPPETIPLVYEYSGGIPRLINTLCDTTLICAFADDIAVISEDVIGTAVMELEWVPFSRRPHRGATLPVAGGEGNPS